MIRTQDGSRAMPVKTMQPQHSLHSKRWWQWTKRLLKVAFFIVVTYLLVSQARTVQWDEVLAAVQHHPVESLVRAALFAAASFALYSCFDLLGRYYTGHQLRTPQVLIVTFISYAFNLNLGALVGGIAFRYRLYSKLGLDAEVTTRVLFISMATNWLGYLLLGGLVFWWGAITLPPEWKVDTVVLRLIGLVMTAAAITYLLLCAFSRKRRWTIRGNELTLPSWRMALLQLLMSSANWLLIAGAVFMVLEKQVPFPEVLAVLLMAAIAGVMAHIPAGLGVLEAVFVALLSHQVPKNELLAAMLIYRAIYYLIPLLLATLAYLALEAGTRKSHASG
jgi:uncharacterized membrane protein YbhN (UPF0104 family)